MIKILDGAKVKTEDVLTRGVVAEQDVESAVTDIINTVREKGDGALFDFTRRFDRAEIASLEVSQQEIDAAYASIEPDFIKTLELARDNIEKFHRLQIRNNFVTTSESGVVLGQRITPIEKVGLYVPGGTASYPSSVLMDAVPAKLAGVKELTIVTPPLRDGSIKAEILAAAKVAGVDRIFRIGGAQAVAALAYGTESVPKVDKIVGPGNVYVATAKRRVYGIVDIDMIAGPSEILVIADGNCRAENVAADLLSQAEHDRLASAVLVTDSMELARAVQAEVERQLSLLPREEMARASIDNNGKIIVVDDLAGAARMSNTIAPEHLELCVDDPFALLGLIKNAGSIFLGKNTPEAIGDYFAGPNHTLPTSGTARFSSPLSVDDFVKKSSFIYYTPEALKEAAPRVADFARREGLEAHARSVEVRTNK